MDNAATSYPKPAEVALAVEEAVSHAGNPGRGAHEYAVWSSVQIDRARESLSELCNIDDPLRVAFTLNATHSLNIAVSLCYGEILTTSMDHNSVLRPCAKRGCYRIVSAEPDGNITARSIISSISDMTGAVVMTHASNVTGQIYDIEPIARECRRRGVLFVLDAAQTAGNTDIDVKRCPVDILCMTGHKSLYGVQGCGAIYVASHVRTRPYMCGGTGSNSFQLLHPEQMPECFEAGTVNTHGVCSLCAGVDYVLQHGVAQIHQKEKALRSYFIRELQRIRGIIIYGPMCGDFTGTISVNIRGCDPVSISTYLAENGVCVRAGYHCAPLAHKTLGTVDMGGTLRFSLNHMNTFAEIDEVIRLLSLYRASFAGRSIQQ